MPNDRRDTALVGRHNNRRPQSVASRQQTAAVVHSAPAGRPRSYTEEIAEEICELLADGYSLLGISCGF